MDSLEQIAHKQRLLRDAARGMKGLTLRMHEAKASVLEGVLARGDRRLGPVIERAYLHGARFDSWDDQLKMDAWTEAFAFYGIDTSVYLGTLPVSARLPWDHLDIGLEDGFLAREYRKALHNRLSPPCGKVAGTFIHHTSVAEAAEDKRRLVCYDCGVACDLTRMREQRIEYLVKLGVQASQPRPIPDPPMPGPHPSPDPNPAPTPDPIPMPPEPNPNPTLARAPWRPPQAGGPPERYRLRFAKTGPSALLGHLDLIRELPRAIRRGGVKMAYTAGFHPKPDMAFGPALSLGVASSDEYVDVKLIDAPEVQALLAQLNGVTCDGLQFLAAARLTPLDPPLAKLIDAARYVIALPELSLVELGGRAGLEARVAEFLATQSHRVRREIKGIGKWVDVRELVADLRLGDAESLAQLERAGFVGRIVPLEVTIRLSQQGSAKVSEVVEALFGAGFPHKALRCGLLAQGGSLMDLERHRRAAPPVVAAAAISA
jgi:radical SAM-linked protein